MRRAELRILRSARAYGLGQTGTIQLSDLQLLAQLQHHGAPTRLLDVTADPMTALWFACRTEPMSDALLLAFNVESYEELQTARAGTTWGDLKDPSGAPLEDAIGASSSRSEPVVIRPSAPDDRMVAQEGYFLLSACPDSPFSDYREVPMPTVSSIHLPSPYPYYPGAVVEDSLFEVHPEFEPFALPVLSFRIPHTLKPTILDGLMRSFGKSASSLFPDVAGFVDNDMSDLKTGGLI